jgi:hypothetical protein
VSPSLRRLTLAGIATALMGSAPAPAQPFNEWLTSAPGYPATSGFVSIPANPALNPTAAFTFEAWVLLSTPDGAEEDCRSIAGKNYLQAWWIGVCNVGGVRTLRTYLKGGSSARNGGRVAVGQWTHVAVVFDGAQRRHYLNGELVFTAAETGPLTTSGDAMRIFSDTAWEHSPAGAIDEVRLWSVARSASQLRVNLNVRVAAPHSGLIAVWTLDGGGGDVIGGRDGVVTGGGVGFLSPPVALDCGSSTATRLCLFDRFAVSARFRVGEPGPAEGVAQTIPCAGPSCEGSGIFWFFSSNNWELMTKVINGCGLNDRYWSFTAGLTNVFFRLEVTDVTSGTTKIYFNYPGPPAPAITDVNALDVCP